MSSVTAKNIILSQPKTGSFDVIKSPVILPNTVSHNEDCTVIKVEIPGVDPSTVDVSCESNTLQVQCECGSFTHSVNPTIDISKIKADIQWGMLTLTIPVPPQPVARSIKINFHDAAPVKKPAAKVSEEE
jgi:HSP20 family molecular chaperone IbpA